MGTAYQDRFQGAVLADMGKQPVDAATTANISLSGYQTIDGVSLNADYMRCLVKNQTDETQNGIYYVFSAAWQRAPDFSGPSGTVNGQWVIATGGTQAGAWQLISPNPVQIDQSGGQSTPASDIIFSPGIPGLNGISAAMQPVVESLNLQAARQAMGIQVDVGFNNQIISPIGDYGQQSGLVFTFPSVLAVVGGNVITIPAYTQTFANNSIIDIWSDSEGNLTDYVGNGTNYTTALPQLTPTLLHVWRIYTDGGIINSVKQMSNTYPTVQRPTDIGYTNDNFVENFYLFPTTTNWAATTAVTYGELLLTTDGNVYQVFLPGTTGASKPTGQATGNIVDGTATLFYYCQKEYLGNYRYAPNNGSESYFNNIGLRRVAHRTLLTGSPLGPGAGTLLTTLIKNYIINQFQHMILNRVSSGTYIKNMKMIAGGYIWLCTTAGTAASSSPFSGSYTPGTSTVTDGTSVWLCLYASYGSQQYFWMDTDRTFLNYTTPDSHDSYWSTFVSLIARYLQLVPGDAGFIFGVSTQPSGSAAYKSYKTIFDAAMAANITNQITGNNLTYTFQGGVSPVDGSSYTIQFTEDNCESWRGCIDGAYLYNAWGDATNQGVMTTNATDIQEGIAALYNTTYNVFATYFGDNVASWINTPNKPFYPLLNTQMFPEFHNVTGITQDVRNNVRTWVSQQYVGWWLDKGKDTFPQNMFGYLAGRMWQDFQKAYAFMENTERYFSIGGALIISEFCYYLDIKDTLVNPVNILQQSGSSLTVENSAQQITTLQTLQSLTFPNAAAAFTLTLPANAYISDIFVQNSDGNALTGGLDIGTTLTGNDIVSALTVGANSVQMIPQVDLLKRIFSTSATQILYFQAHSSWNAANISVEVRYSILGI